MTIKWYDPGATASMPGVWYVGKTEPVEINKVYWSLKKIQNDEVYVTTALSCVIIGYREFWTFDTEIATRHVQYAAVTKQVSHKFLPYVTIETTSHYVPVLLRDLQQQKRVADFFREVSNAWEELFNESDICKTFYSKETPLWAYWFYIKSNTVYIPGSLAKVPDIHHYGDVHKKFLKDYEEIAKVAKQNGFITELPAELGVAVIDYVQKDFASFAAF